MSKHTEGPWIHEHGTADHYHICQQATRLNIATTCDRLTMASSAAAKSMEEDEANARLIAAAPDLAAVALAYQRWEADLVLADDAWPGMQATPTIPQRLWDRLLEIQAMRNAAVAKARGEAR